MKVLIVDDEPLAREGIRQLVEREADVVIVGECGDGKQALKVIRDESPDLVFLDIQMPEMDGFALLESLSPEKMPRVIFVTAYDQYAVRAFEVHALDYVLKPLDEERFQKTWERATEQIRGRKDAGWLDGIQSLLQELAEGKGGGQGHYADRMIIKTDGRVFFVRVKDMDWIEAQGNYVMIHVGKESHLVRDAISKIEEDLDPRLFLRIHRSTIVNIDRIQELQSLFHGDYRVLLKDGTKLLLSRRYRSKARDALGKSL